MPKTDRLAIKILESDKQILECMAQAEGEPVAVIARRIIRRAVREFAEAQAVRSGNPPAMESEEVACVNQAT